MSSGGTTYLLHIKLSQIIICQQMKVFLRVSFHNSVGISVPTLTVPTLAAMLQGRRPGRLHRYSFSLVQS